MPINADQLDCLLSRRPCNLTEPVDISRPITQKLALNRELARTNNEPPFCTVFLGAQKRQPSDFEANGSTSAGEYRPRMHFCLVRFVQKCCLKAEIDVEGLGTKYVR